MLELWAMNSVQWDRQLRCLYDEQMAGSDDVRVIYGESNVLVEHGVVIYLNPSTSNGRKRYKIRGDEMKFLLQFDPHELTTGIIMDGTEDKRIERVMKEHQMLSECTERLCKNLRKKYISIDDLDSKALQMARVLHEEFKDLPVEDRPCIIVDRDIYKSGPLSNDDRTFNPFDPPSKKSRRVHKTLRGKPTLENIKMQLDYRKAWGREVKMLLEEKGNNEMSRLHAHWEKFPEEYPSFWAAVFDSRVTRSDDIPRCRNCVYLDKRGFNWEYRREERPDGSVMRRFKTPTDIFYGVEYYKVYVPFYTKEFTLPTKAKGTIFDGFKIGLGSFWHFDSVKKDKTASKRLDKHKLRFGSDKKSTRKFEFSALVDLQNAPWCVNTKPTSVETEPVIHFEDPEVLYKQSVNNLDRPLHYKDFLFVKVDEIPHNASGYYRHFYMHPWETAPRVITSRRGNEFIGPASPSEEHLDNFIVNGPYRKNNTFQYGLRSRIKGTARGGNNPPQILNGPNYTPTPNKTGKKQIFAVS